MKSHLRNYSFYLISSFLKLGLFYFVARKFSQSSFIQYNAYLYCSDIILVLVSSGTCTYFSFKQETENQLKFALAFENIFFVLLLFSIAILKQTGINLMPHQLNVTILILLTWGRINTQIFSRYFTFFETIPKSLINDGVSNYLWIIGIFIWTWFHPNSNIETLIWTWIFFLLGTNIFNLFKHQRKIRANPILSFKKLSLFLGVYFSAIQFSVLEKSFFSYEKIIALAKFDNLDFTSSYLFASKIIGYAVEVSTAFTGIVLVNNLVKLDNPKSQFLKKAITLNSIAFILIFIAAITFSPFVLKIFGNQISRNYLYLLFLVIPIYAFNNIHGLLSIFFQRRQKLKYLNIIATIQLATLGILYLFPKNPFWYIGFQIGIWGIILIASLLYRNKLNGKDMPISSDVLVGF